MEYMEKFKEEDFYKDEGWPPEEYSYCKYALPIFGEEKTEDSDYDQFAIVKNAIYPYIRLTKKRGSNHLPCGLATSPSTNGFFATKTDKERDEICPKIAWGITAVFLFNLWYDSAQKDYVLLKPIKEVYTNYYRGYRDSYYQSHSGLKYAHISELEKELSFIEEHLVITKQFWKKSTALEFYSDIYNYAQDAEKGYETFLLERKHEIQKTMNGNNCFSTEICSVFDKPYVKVYFLDDSVAPQAKAVIEALNVVRKVNITESKSSAHPGNTLTVYQKPMVSAEHCEKEVTDVLKRFFANEVVGDMSVRNEAKFAEIETHILEYLNMAVATIDVCVAWFTIDELRDKLLEKAREGVKVRIIIYRDGVNHKNGVDLTGLNYKEYRGERGGIMHDKFCVIDNVHTICGSFNWTRSAEEKNDEDAAFHKEDYRFASEYTKRFNQMWERDGSSE